MLVVDTVDSTRPDRDEQIRLHMHRSLYQILREALGDFGISWASCHVQHRGDGALIVLPPEYPVTCLIDAFPDRLAALIRRYNRVSAEPARMQLRAAVHVGPVYLDEDGISGDDVTLLCRTLEAPEISYPLAWPDSVLAFVVSNYVYANVVQRHPGMTDPGAFKPMSSLVKHTHIEAWVLAGDRTQWPPVIPPAA